MSGTHCLSMLCLLVLLLVLYLMTESNKKSNQTKGQTKQKVKPMKVLLNKTEKRIKIKRNKIIIVIIMIHACRIKIMD